MKRSEKIALLQGTYFFLTGVWPILHLESFLWVTGPKTDLWLIKTVGLLIAVVGAAIFLAGIRSRVTPEIKWLAVGSAAGLAFIDVYYYLDGTLRWVYLLDAGAEAVLIGLWIWATGSREKQWPK
jgi:hypothetical protein